MTYDSEHYYAVQSFLEDDELCKIWNIIEIAMNREGYDVSNAELSMRLYDKNWTETTTWSIYNTMKFNVTEVEFDFDDDYAEESKLTFDEEIEIRDLALGVWDAEDEDDLIEEVTTACGWCIKNIDYEIQLK